MSKKEPTVGSGLVALLGAEASEPVAPEAPAEDRLKAQIVSNQEQQAEIAKFRDTLAQFKEPATDPELLRAALKSALETLRAAKQLTKDAQANQAFRQAQFDQVQAQVLALDTMTETERNQEYLAAQKKLREEAAKEQQARYASLLKAGLLSAEEMQKLAPPVTPLDRAIGERNQKIRQQQNAGSLMRR